MKFVLAHDNEASDTFFLCQTRRDEIIAAVISSANAVLTRAHFLKDLAIIVVEHVAEYVEGELCKLTKPHTVTKLGNACHFANRELWGPCVVQYVIYADAFFPALETKFLTSCIWNSRCPACERTYGDFFEKLTAKSFAIVAFPDKPNAAFRRQHLVDLRHLKIDSMVSECAIVEQNKVSLKKGT